MAKGKGRGSKGAKTKKKGPTSSQGKSGHDVYEDEEVVDKRELAGKYDVDTIAEAELPSDFEDEEISEDDAFNSEDEQIYGAVLETINKNSKKRKADAEADETSDVDDDEEDEEEDDDEGPLHDGEIMLSSLLGDEPQKRLSTVDDGLKPTADDEEDLQSTDEESETDEEKHRNLLSLVGVQVDGKQRSRKKRAVTEAAPESEFGAAPTEELTLETLMGSLTESSTAVSTLKKQLSTNKKSSKDGPLPAPRAAIVEERAERKVAYGKAAENVSKYQAVVKANREAETLNLKAQQVPPRTNLSNAALASKFEPSTELEKTVQNLLQSAGMESEKKIAEGELRELADKSLDPEAAKAKYAEMAKLRSLIFYEEQKRKRISKIKSKLYHKIRKKQKKGLTKEEELELLRETNPEAAAAMEEEAAERRAAERMSLRHQNTSDWVRSALKKGQSADVDTRKAVAEQLHQAQELKRKIERVGESDSEISDTEATIEAVQATLATKDDGEAPKKGLMSMKFMQKAMERQREAAREEAESLLHELRQAKEEEEWSSSDERRPDPAASTARKDRKRQQITEADVKAVKAVLSGGSMQATFVQMDGRFSSKVDGPISVSLPKQRESGEDQEDDHASESEVKVMRTEVEVITPAKGPKASQKTKEAERPQEKGENPWLLASSTQQTEKKDLRGVHGKKNKRLAAAALNEAAKPLKMDVKIKEKEQKQANTITEGAKGKKRNREKDGTEELVRQAFALDDDLEEELIREKEEEADIAVTSKLDPKAAVGVAGWGSWAGIGVQPSRRQKEKERAYKEKVEEAKAKALEGRTDAKLRHVIINEKRDKKLAKYTASQVPYPFTSREQYERSLRNPLGRDWNTATATHKLTRPEVITRRGAIIEPIKLTKLQKEEASARNQQRGKRRKL